MIAKIVPSSNSQILDSQPVILYRYDWKTDDEDPTDESKYYCHKIFFNYDKNNIITNVKNDNDDDSKWFLGSTDKEQKSVFNVQLYQKNKEIPRIVVEDAEKENYSVKWNIAGNPKTLSSFNFSRYIKNDNGELIWNELYNINNPSVYILRAQINYQEKDYYSFYNLPVIFYNSENIPNYKLIGINKKTLLKEIIYNADGRYPIYNHNQGIELTNLPEDSFIIWTALGGKSDDSESADFSLLKNKDDKKELAEKVLLLYKNQDKDPNKEGDEGESVVFPYASNMVDNPGMIYILPNDEYNGGNTNNRVVGYIYKTQVKNDEKNIFNIYQENKQEIINKTKEKINEEIYKNIYPEENKNTLSSSKISQSKGFYCEITMVQEENVPILIYKYVSLKNFEENKKYCKIKAIQIVSNNTQNLEEYQIKQSNVNIETLLIKNGNENTFKEYQEEKGLTLPTSGWYYVVDRQSLFYTSNNYFNQWKEQKLLELQTNLEEKILKVTQNNLIAVVTIPINMTLNTFGLSSLNAWDGNTVTIDEEEGYVMAPQVGAGEKDSNNRFTGILMGKTETYTGSSEKNIETGLFGYAHGLQSIFLDANTGKAIFGLPNGYRLNEVNNTLEPATGDTYNEGRIELIPGGESKIGGWRLGRQSLYYTSSGEIGNKYSNDYIPTSSGAIQKDNKQIYTKHHVKDIKESDSGILIHAGIDPYLSIKGRLLDPENADKDILSVNGDSLLRTNDSLEIQLDPKTPTLFTIFRHNGQQRKKTNGEVLYPVGSRTFLAGINGRGELVANGLQDVAASGQGETITTFKVRSVSAFGYGMDDETPYIGLSAGAGDDTIVKLFTKKRESLPLADQNSSKETTLYLSGASNKNNEYQRPLSLHGKSISLYADDNINNHRKEEITNTKIILDNTKLEAGNFDTSYLKLYTSINNTNEIHTVGDLNIETTSNNNRADNKKDSDEEKIPKYGNIQLLAGPSNMRSSLILNNNFGAELSGHTKLKLKTDSGPITIRPAQDFIVEKGTGSILLSNSAGNALTIAGSNTGANTLNVGGPFSITSGGVISITTSSTSTNTLNISTGIGSFAIQKSNLKSNSIYSNDLGFRGQYGYFEDVYDNYNNSVYAYGRFITDYWGAQGYAFGANPDDRYGLWHYSADDERYPISGNNMGSLIVEILNHLSGIKDAIDKKQDKPRDGYHYPEVRNGESIVLGSDIKDNYGNWIFSSADHAHTVKYNLNTVVSSVSKDSEGYVVDYSTTNVVNELDERGRYSVSTSGPN